MITEAEQREAWEWLHPELKGEFWVLYSDGGSQRAIYDSGWASMELPPLYTNGQPDLNTAREFLSKLHEKGVHFNFTNLDDAGRWHLHEYVDSEMKHYEDTDFYAAFSQWREAQ